VAKTSNNHGGALMRRIASRSVISSLLVVAVAGGVARTGALHER